MITASGWGPTEAAKPTKEQLAYSKQMFAEGEQAMEDGNYAEALTKFHEGYRYAPHLHVFTYNIGSAAEAAGDCRTALTYFRMFLDLVPDHPERKTVQKKHDTLAAECRFDVDSEVVNTPGEQTDRKLAREEREAIHAMNEAVIELRVAWRTYELAHRAHADVGVFGRAARRKKQGTKRMRKLAAELGVKLEAEADRKPAALGTAKEACREAERQEHRIIEAVESVLVHYDGRKAQRVAGNVLRAAERDEATFEGCR